jgi:hypothetical protein
MGIAKHLNLATEPLNATDLITALSGVRWPLTGLSARCSCCASSEMPCSPFISLWAPVKRQKGIIDLNENVGADVCDEGCSPLSVGCNDAGAGTGWQGPSTPGLAPRDAFISWSTAGSGKKTAKNEPSF